MEKETLKNHSKLENCCVHKKKGYNCERGHHVNFNCKDYANKTKSKMFNSFSQIYETNPHIWLDEAIITDGRLATAENRLQNIGVRTYNTFSITRLLFSWFYFKYSWFNIPLEFNRSCTIWQISVSWYENVRDFPDGWEPRMNIRPTFVHCRSENTERYSFCCW